MTRALVMLIVLSAIAGCDRNTPASTSQPPAQSFPLPDETGRATTHEGLSTAFCERWQATPLDLSPLHVGPSDAVSAERDGRGGITIAASASDGSLTAATVTSGGLGESVHIAQPASVRVPGAPLRHVEAAPNGTWVVAWNEGGVFRRDPDGSFTSLTDGLDAQFGVSEDGWVGVSDAQGIRYVPLAGGQPVVIASHPLFSVEASAWFEGRFVALVGDPDPELQVMAMDGSFDAAPVPTIDAGTHADPILGADGSFGAILHDDATTIGVALTTPDVPGISYAFDAPFDVWGGATMRATSGMVLVGAQRGLTGSVGSQLQLSEVVADGTRSAITVLGTMPATPTRITVSATSDGDTIVVYAANASLGRAWVAHCEGGGV